MRSRPHQFDADLNTGRVSGNSRPTEARQLVSALPQWRWLLRRWCRLSVPIGIFSLCFALATSWAADPNRFDQLLDSANTARSSNPQLFAEILAELDAESAALSDRQSVYLEFLAGYQTAFGGDLEGAMSRYRSVLARSSDVALVFRAGYAMVNVYSINHDWTRGLVQLEETLALSDQIEDLGVRQEGWMVAGVFYNQLGQYELALDYTERLFASTSLTGRNLCIAHHSRLEALMKLGRLDTDSPAISQGIASCLLVDEPVIVNFIRANLAQLYIDNGQYQQAYDALVGHLEQIESSRYKRLIAEAYAVLSQAELGLGRGQSAIAHAQQALDNSEGYLLTKAYWTLKEYYRQQKDFAAAFDNQVKFTEAEKGALDDQSKKQLAFQLARQQVLEKNQQIALLSQQNHVLQLSEKLAMETAAKDRLVLYLVILIAVSLAFWGYYLKRTQRRLRVLAEYDGLTGLNNRRHFSKSAEDLLSYCKSEHQEASLIMFDMDKFKHINDTYGHPAGDWVLQKTAEVVRDQGRQNDLIGRIGGEEFAILLPSCKLSDSRKIAEQYRQAIERIDCSTLGKNVNISASFGVTTCKRSGYTLEKLMSDCDAALYQAKHLGRNQVVSVEKRHH